MGSNIEKCFGQQFLQWESCMGLELEGKRQRILGRLCCDQCIKATALTDELTKLPNRHSLSSAFVGFRDNKRPFGALLIDLSSFKHVNDTFGHQKGDEMLVHTAEFLKEGIRESDDFFVGRQGGDEFAVLLDLTPRQAEELTSEHRLQTVGSRLAKAYALSDDVVEYNNLSEVPDDKRLKMNYGYAIWQEGMDLNELLASADCKGPADSNPQR